MKARAAAIVFATVSAALTSSCSLTKPDTTVVRVFAVPSMAATLTTMAGQFEQDHPGTHVEFRFGRGASLARQLEQGESADVFVASTPQSMDRLEALADIDTPTFFITNRAVIVVPRGNPRTITGPASLVREDLDVAVCPRGQHDACGDLARDAFGLLRLTVKPTRAYDEQDVLDQVAGGAADAGIVYATDVLASRQPVETVEIPPRFAIGSSYGIATVKDSDHARLARDFVQIVTSPASRTLLRTAGFGAPQETG
ncbi:molybdate ABC transporter substrate-binding protein [Nocardioides aurantiacus]|uniref:Molybdate transport system substrate-binding protein n=1 Tax=Nocardioides aurantiacus TaxID=86796 RepID=A0A3N2CUL7_9ACTN|nr:molybdate ABC transporter substrate-binding protein [Nocardioides aurantiacus]ROR91108.1 molybdate transport system substrate-binding protein [Nocardioides aurantiacus]